MIPVCVCVYIFQTAMFHTTQVIVGSRGTWSLSQESWGTRRGTPWTGCQSIAGHNHIHTHTPIHTLRTLLDTPISLTMHVFGHVF
ncbi:hypothetical protein AMELA_G00152740 [Ameiurus melas]|uniref:Uncharacterized protein n=1 Tax=Ameiurus melas TaxID=219545 RepID=A0A7J6AIF0_AMEME|nr:hypothetical protein AMELA_G00152740 [Ameiurus melas]